MSSAQFPKNESTRELSFSALGTGDTRPFFCDPLMETVTILFSFGVKEICVFLILPSGTLDFKKLIASPWAFTKDLGSWGTKTYMTWVPMCTRCHSCLITYLTSLHLWGNSMREVLSPFDREKKPGDQTD